MEAQKLIKVVGLIMSLLLTSMINGQTPWELKKEDEGISAYTRSRPGIKFKEYKVEMEIEASHSQVLAIFKDFEVHSHLFPGTENIKVMLDEGEHYITYVKFNLPFPARDRDALFDNTITYDRPSQTLRVDVACLEDGYATNPDLIQMTYCKGFWSFTATGDGKMKVVNQLIVDPGGFAPAFIVNSKTVDDPIKTFKSFREMIKHSKYRGHSFSLLDN